MDVKEEDVIPEGKVTENNDVQKETQPSDDKVQVQAKKPTTAEKKAGTKRKNVEKQVSEVVDDDVANDNVVKIEREGSPEYLPSLRKQFSTGAKKRKANFKHSLENSKNLKSVSTAAAEKRSTIAQTTAHQRGLGEKSFVC
jgi:hypothetical protein